MPRACTANEATSARCGRSGWYRSVGRSISVPCTQTLASPSSLCRARALGFVATDEVSTVEEAPANSGLVKRIG